jgi:hypothetical protein
VAKLPYSVVKRLVAVADEREFGEVAAGVFSTLVADLAGDAHPAKRVEQLGVYEVWRVEIAVLGEALDQSRRGIERGDCLEDCRGVSYKHG